MVGMLIIFVDGVESDIIACGEVVIGVDLRIDHIGDGGNLVVLGHADESVEVVVDWLAESEMDVPLAARETCGHVGKILVWRLLVACVVAFLLELEGLEGVARVVLVGYGHGDDVELTEIGDEIGFAAKVQHLEDAALSSVVAILRAAFALRNPDVLMTIGDAVAHVGRERGRGVHLLADRIPRLTTNDLLSLTRSSIQS